MKSKVQLLLMQDVDTLGKMGEVVDVASGYARNFLLPRGFAAPVTEASRKKMEKQRKLRHQQDESKKAAHKELARKLGTVSLSISAAAGADGKLFGSVTEREIVQALKAEGIEVEAGQVTMKEHLKALGTHDIAIRLDAELTVPLKVWIVEK